MVLKFFCLKQDHKHARSGKRQKAITRCCLGLNPIKEHLLVRVAILSTYTPLLIQISYTLVGHARDQSHNERSVERGPDLPSKRLIEELK